jgi:SOS-response transcriptional repressor LexA
MFSGAKRTVGHEIALRIADAFGESRLKWLDAAGYGRLLEAVAEDLDLLPTDVMQAAQDLSSKTDLPAQTHRQWLPASFMEGCDCAIRVAGPAMEPVLQDGALVAVKAKETPGDGGLVAFRINGLVAVRRLQGHGARALLVPDNPVVPPTPLRGVSVLGVPVRKLSVQSLSGR